VILKFKLSSLDLNERAADKFKRLVGERYNDKNDLVTITANRCPYRNQNEDYAMYLLKTLYFESQVIL
jgi:small subunit ribosomal protein S35